MYLGWTKHLKSPKEQEEFSKYIRGSKALFERLKQIVEEEKQTIEITSLDFDNPNWAIREAFNKGQHQSLNKILKIINIEDNR